MDKNIFKSELKRLLRQLDQRNRLMELNKKEDSYYQNKRREFINLIDAATKEIGFIMPKENTRIYKIYHDKW